jgi:hypothetical protein
MSRRRKRRKWIRKFLRAYNEWFAREIDNRIIRDFSRRVTGFQFTQSELMPDLNLKGKK